jgi:hypothetical protein
MENLEKQENIEENMQNDNHLNIIQYYSIILHHVKNI